MLMASHSLDGFVFDCDSTRCEILDIEIQQKQHQHVNKSIWFFDVDVVPLLNVRIV